jgi:hypothetical protein
LVEFSNDADPFGIWSPDAKTNTSDAIDFVHVGAEEAVCVAMFTLAEQMQVKILQLGRKTVRVMRDVFTMAVFVPYQTVAVGHCAGIASPLKEISASYTLELKIAFCDKNLVGSGEKSPH